MTPTTGRARRTLTAVAAACVGLLLATTVAAPSATAGAEAASSAAPETASASLLQRPGNRQYLRRRSTPATGWVAPRPLGAARVSAATSTFVVTYHGFTAEAKASFQRAVDLWSVLVDSDVPIRIDATFEELEPGVLGGAGPTTIIRDFPGAPVGSTWYPSALANARAGSDLVPGGDIEAVFQSSSAAGWYFGADGSVPSNQTDFTTVVLHEIGHGLGIVDSTSVEGGKAVWGFDDGAGHILPLAYDRLVRYNETDPLIGLAQRSAALLAALRGGALRWSGAQAVAAAGGTKPRLYSPTSYLPGSSVSHLDEALYPAGTADALMTPFLDDGEAVHDPGDIALGMLRDMGWTTVGAKGVPAAPALTNAIGGDGRVIVAWKPPIDTGRQPLTGFRVSRYDDGASTASATVDVPGGSVSSTSINGLANGTPYRFTVAATNASGTGAESAKSASIQPAAMAPFSRSDVLVRQQFLDFHGRSPTSAESVTWIAGLHAGTTTPGGTVAGIAKLPGSYDVSTRTTRLYFAYFDRLPDFGGYTYWSGKLRKGSSLKQASDTFAASSEFANKYGSLSNGAFVDRVYLNVLHRAPDPSGRAYWVGKLNTGSVSRGQVMLSFSESNENITKMESEVDAVLLRAGMLRQMPTKLQHQADVVLLDGPATMATLAGAVMADPAYDARVP